MNLLNYGLSQISVITYVAHSGSQNGPVTLPQLPHLISVERVLLLLLFIFLVKPLLREQKDPVLEKQRVDVLKLSAAVGGVAIIIHFYRLISGH